MILSSDRFYFINNRKGRFSTTDFENRYNIFFMDDTNKYEWFPIKNTIIKSDTKKNNELRKYFNKQKKMEKLQNDFIKQ